MFFEEDPFDRWCRLLVAFLCIVTHTTEITVLSLFQRLKILGRHHLVIAWIRTSSWSFSWYKRYVCVPLMFCGLMKVPTWTEVEAYRLRLTAKSGHELPRPTELEEGLRQEQRRQKNDGSDPIIGSQQ